MCVATVDVLFVLSYYTQEKCVERVSPKRRARQTCGTINVRHRQLIKRREQYVCASWPDIFEEAQFPALCLVRIKGKSKDY